MRCVTVWLLVAVALRFLFADSAAALVTREEGVKSIAGVLESNGVDEYAFRAQAGQILFVDLDGFLYQVRGEHEEEHEAGTDTSASAITAEEGDGCSEEGGPGQFCVQVLLDGAVLAMAGRPAPPPGWSRDPRLALILGESSLKYVLRVFWTEEIEGGCESGIATPPAEPLPYLLNFSLRDEAPEGRIESAVGQSQSGF
jgi:hypothetical protein